MSLFTSQITGGDHAFITSEFASPNTPNLASNADLDDKYKKLEEKVDILMANQKVIMRQQAETLAILKQLLHKDVGSFKNRSVFPLNTLEALKALNEEILAGSSESYIKIIKNIIGKSGIVKSIEGIFERSLIVDINYDGIHSKFALKECKGLMDCLYEASRKDGYCHADFIKDVRQALKLAKNRQHKTNCLKSKIPKNYN